jgi:hypothetical protein
LENISQFNKDKKFASDYDDEPKNLTKYFKFLLL